MRSIGATARRSTLGHALRALVIAAWACSMSACFPYRETYRPMITGVVIDEAGAPVAGAPVETCSETRWVPLKGDCPRRFTTVTAADGSFAVPLIKEVDWCCLGEAPTPITIVSVCLPDGRLGGASADGSRELNLRIPVSPVGALSLARHDEWSARSDRESDVKSRCAARAGVSSKPSTP